MNKETLEAIDSEAEVFRFQNFINVPESEPSYIAGAQSKAARDYWIRWAFEKAREECLSAQIGVTELLPRTAEDLITLADKEQGDETKK